MSEGVMSEGVMDKRSYYNSETNKRLMKSDIGRMLSPGRDKTMQKEFNFYDDKNELFSIPLGTKVEYDKDTYHGASYIFYAKSKLNPDKEYEFSIDHLSRVAKKERVNGKWVYHHYDGGSMHRPIPRKPSSNTETAKWSLMTKKKAGGKRKKGKTQKKRKSTKKRNNKKKKQ